MERWLNSFKHIYEFKNIYLELVQQQIALTDQTFRLVQERSEFTSLIEGFPDGILFHHQGKILFANKKMKSFLNYSDSSLVGKSVFEIISPTYHEIIKKRMEAVAQNQDLQGKPLEVEFEIFGSDKHFYGECTSTNLHYLGMPCVAVIARDLSERKSYETHLLETDRLASLGQMAAGVGHEVNNPLCFIVLKLEILKEQLAAKSDTSAIDSICEIEDGISRIQTIVGDLKTLSRDHGDDLSSFVDITKTLVAAISMAKNEIQQRAQLEVEITDLSPLLVNEARLGQIFLNLLINAAQAIEPGNINKNKIIVRAYNDGPMVTVQISDTGSGIPEFVQENLFKPFYTTKPVGQGTGLGLSICKSLVGRFNGTLSFKSENGIGTTFTVSFPAAKELNLRTHVGPIEIDQHVPDRMKNNAAIHENRQIYDSSDQASRGKDLSLSKQSKKRILVIDDDDMVLETLAGVLSKNYIPVALNDAAAALAELNSGVQFDAIICDLMMPNMNGMQFYDALKKLNSEFCQKVIFLTGGSFTEIADTFLNQKEIISFQKPIRKKELFEILEKITDGSLNLNGSSAAE